MQYDVLLILKYLERTLRLKLTCRMQPRLDPDLRDYIRFIWKTWRNAPRVEPIPRGVLRAVVATCFRLSAKLGDARLKEACHSFCLAGGLYEQGPRGGGHSLVVEFIMASLASDYHSWSAMIARLDLVLPNRSWKATVLPQCVRHLAVEDPSILAGLQHPLMSCLSDSSNNISQKQDVLEAFLITIYLSGAERMYSDWCKVVAREMLVAYAGCRPSSRARNALQNMVLVFVNSGHPSQASRVVRGVQQRFPGYFPDPFLTTLSRSLFRRRQYRLAVRVLGMVTPASSQRELAVEMGRRGATSLEITQWRWSPQCRQPARARPARATRLLTLRLSSKAARHSHDPHLAQNTISALVLAGRFAAARKIFQRTQGILDVDVRTKLGNIILDGIVQRMAYRNGRLVRTVMRTTHHYSQHYDFVRDRVTVNILLKAILRWRTYIDLPKVKALFDHMIRGGYPAAAHFRRGDVPFATHPSVTTTLSLPPLSPHISFVKHVRPMYKMFIKAFHLRGDRRAAATVIGILKAEEAYERAKREEKNRMVAMNSMKYIESRRRP
ncbi:hypothetical protein ONZ45_g2156 [Pleurotus djamor]|nr:hypothetical protein ONZ45_g2156 [Pleurotus djamor]